MNHVKLRESRGPCRDYVGISILFVKNYDSRKTLRDSCKTTWFIKNSLITFSLKEIVPIFGYIFYNRNWYYRHSWETRPKLRNSGKTRGFMKTPGFRPSLVCLGPLSLESVDSRWFVIIRAGIIIFNGFDYVLVSKKCQILPPFSKFPPYFKYSDPDYLRIALYRPRALADSCKKNMFFVFASIRAPMYRTNVLCTREIN